MLRIGKWRKMLGGMSPGGTPFYVCGHCGGSGHPHGVEYPKRKVVCDECGRINIYPWEMALEQLTYRWEDDEEEE